ARRAVLTPHVALCSRRTSRCAHAARRAVLTPHVALCSRRTSRCAHAARRAVLTPHVALRSRRAPPLDAVVPPRRLRRLGARARGGRRPSTRAARRRTLVGASTHRFLQPHVA